MSAIWHDSKQPGWLAAGPQFSFHEVAEIVVPAPASYAEARGRMQAWERKVGAAYLQHNADLTHAFWQANKPWWLF